MSTLTHTGTWTYERMVAELPPESRYELQDGVLLDMSPAPTPFHQNVLFSLALLFGNFLKVNRLGKAFVAPLDIVFDEKNVAQPDLMIVLGAVDVPEKGWLKRIPDLAVEILSPRSMRRDQFEKRALYARYGVKEYWVIDPANRYVEVNRLQEGAYALHQWAAEEQEAPKQVESALLPGLIATVEEVFAS